jgi:hypothetical protein
MVPIVEVDEVVEVLVVVSPDLVLDFEACGEASGELEETLLVGMVMAGTVHPMRASVISPSSPHREDCMNRYPTVKYRRRGTCRAPICC